MLMQLPVDDEVRQHIAQRYATEGLESLLSELKILDPEYYDLVDHRNHKRVVHALEICYMTGRTYTSMRISQTKQRPFRIVKFGLMRERANLFERINRRVDKMMEQGFMDEARKVFPLRHLNSLNTRVYAKKQMTWYKRDRDIHWLEADKMDVETMLHKIEYEIISQKNL